MKALRVHAIGSLDHVTLDEIDPPSPGAHETIVRVAAAGVNPIDAKVVIDGAKNLKPPRTLGIDFAGTVVSSVRFAPGTRVFGSGTGFGVARDGAFAEQVRIDDALVVPMPDGLEFAHAASLGVVFLTAHMAVIDAGATRAEDTVLVHGAGGAVGQACVQFAARVVGARVIAVVSSDEAANTARTLGAAETIDRTREDFAAVVRARTEGRGADVIIDVVGGKVFESSVTLLAPFGRLVAVGRSASAPRTVTFDLVDFYRANRRIVGITSGVLDGADRARRLGEIAASMVAGKLAPPTLDLVPLERGREVLARTMSPDGAHGKIVLTI